MNASLIPHQTPTTIHPAAQPAPRSVAIVLCNLGTPDAPTPKALRRYLAQFLSDRRVVEIPPLFWLPILHGIILRVRPRKAAAKYASVWSEAGSPLAVWTQRQAELLGQRLQQAGLDIPVLPAMRYGQPAIERQLQALHAQGRQRVLLLPLYPQYCAATTASVFDAATLWLQRARSFPELRLVNDYHDHPGYIGALADSVRQHWQQQGKAAEHLVISFHGIPARNVQLGDPYADQCQRTAQLLAQALQLPPERLSVTFQSRFGPAQWLQPYTEPTLQALAKAGTRSVEVICPGFASDCLETLEEISMEAREAFLEAGGQEFAYIPCLNDRSSHIDLLEQLVQQHVAGWVEGWVDMQQK